jgi:hypothetical protein
MQSADKCQPITSPDFRNPTPDEDSLLRVKWRPVTTSVFPCMNIGPTLKLDNFPEVKKRMEFWDNLDQEV